MTDCHPRFVTDRRLPIPCRGQLSALQEAHAAEVGTLQVSAIDDRLEQVGSGQICTDETRVAQDRPAKIGSLQVSTIEVRSGQIETPQPGPAPGPA